MTYNSHKSGPDRVFDHLYDPLYITSGPKDIWKENHNALYRSAPVNIYPQYGTMFTDLPKRPRNYYIQQQNPLPYFPFTDDTLNVDENKNENRCKTAAISGRDRAKFFDIPLNNEITMNLKLDLNDHHVCHQALSKSPKQAFRTIGCETIYREQSAQTKPWMPDAIIDEKATETPEVIYAADLIEGDDPPGIFEVKRIERARRRRQWEKSLSKCKSADDLNKRKTILEALEWEEHIARENEIDYCQKIRFGFVEKMLNTRETKMQQNFDNQMQITANRLREEKERKLSNLRTNHQRTLRRLDKKFRGTSKTSNVAALDHRPDHKPTNFMSYDTDYEARLDGLHNMPTKPTNLERFIQPKIDITKPKLPIKEVKKGFWTDKYLIDLYESLKVMQRKAAHQRVANCLVDIREEILSYVTTAHPSVDTYTNELEYQHTVFLQKIIKGRALQVILHEGKNANQELINQLKESFELESVWMAKAFDDWNEDSLMDCLMLYLDKEFARYAEQKKTRELYLLAEKERLRKKVQAQKAVQDEMSGCFENILTECFNTLSKYDDRAGCDDLTMVSDVLNDLVLPAVYDQLEENVNVLTEDNLQELVKDNEECRSPTNNLIVNDAIEHLIKIVIPHPADNVADTVIDNIVKKVVFADEVNRGINTPSDEVNRDIHTPSDEVNRDIHTPSDEMSSENSYNQICGIMEDLCGQLLPFTKTGKRIKENEDEDYSSDDTEN